MIKILSNRNKKAFVPNILTALNIFSGFVSIIFSTDSEFMIAAYLIFLAAIFDLLDGIVARLLKTTSEYGVQLDSLSDSVSFGAAPALLIYKSYLFTYGWLGIFISSMLLIFGILRLARFNVQVEDTKVKSDFKGLPIPVSALTVATFIMMFQPDGIPVPPYSYLAIPLVIILSILMVSNVQYSAFPKLKINTLKENPVVLLFILYSFALLYFTRNYGLFLIFATLIIFGILKYLYNFLSNNKFSNSGEKDT